MNALRTRGQTDGSIDRLRADGRRRAACSTTRRSGDGKDGHCRCSGKRSGNVIANHASLRRIGQPCQLHLRRVQLRRRAPQGTARV